MSLPRPSSPRAVWSDLKAFLRGREKHQLFAAGAALVIPAILVTGFYFDARSLGPKEQVIYVESWSADRSDAEIIARQKVEQVEEEKRRAARQESYRKLKEKVPI